MSENSMSVSGGTNPCFVYFVRFQDCVKREAFGKLFCNDEFEDFAECKTQTKHVSTKLI